MAQINYVNINGTDYPVDPEAFSNLAPVYDSTATYAVNDHVIYNYLLYRCKTAITTAEAWTAAHWEQVQVSDGMVKPASSSGTYVISQDNGNMSLTDMSGAMLSLFGLSVVDGAINLTYQE